MKKLLLTLFCLFAIFTVKAQCDYTISGSDTYGDGWNGGFVTISVNNVETNFTVPSSANANEVVTLSIPTYTDDPVTFTWNAGGFTSEVRFGVTSPDGTVLYPFGTAPADGTIFVSDTSVSTCAPPSCSNPSSLASSNLTDTTADLAWTAGGTETSWDIEVVNLSLGETATGTPTANALTNPYQLTGLASGNLHEVYVRANCGGGDVSDWISTSFTTTGDPGCGSIVTDTGGFDGDYSSNELYEINYKSSGDLVTLNFTLVDLETCCDNLSVYDGPDSSAPVLNADLIAPASFTASTEDGLTILFDSDGSVQGAGWEATLTCTPLPSCFAPSTLAISNIAADGAQVDFVSGNTTPSGSYEYELVNLTNSEVADGSTDGTATTNPFTLSGLVENASYEIYIKEICGVGDESDFSSAATWTQLINAPGCASNFSPVDGATQVNTNVIFTLDAPTTGGTAADYTFFLGTDPAALNNIGTVAGTSVSITGLNISTTYYWQVIPNNAVGSASGCVINQFTTKTPPSGPDGLTCLAGDESTSQYTESFDAQGDWTGDFGTGNDTWRFTTTTTVSSDTGPSSGQDGSYIYFEASGSNTNSAAIVSPVIDLTAIDAGDDAELTFYMHAYGQGMGTLEVGASTSQAGPFTNLLTWDGQIQTSSAADWLQVGLDISSYTGGNLYIEFKQTGATDYRGDMSIDTMEVIACTEIPTCQIPNTLTATISSGGATTIDWVDPNDPAEEDFDYELLDVTAGETATGVPTGQVTTNSLDLTSLVDGNDYSILVRTACSRGGLSGEIYSDWSPAFSWNQTELPGCATNLSPAEGETVYGGRVTFTFDAPTTGGTATSYDFYYGLNGAAATNFLLNSATSPFIVNFPLGNHNYSIVAKNITGDAVSCTSVNFTIEGTPPSPTGLTCDAGDESTSQFTESFDAQGSWTGDFGGSGGWQFDTNSTTSSGTGPTGPQDAGGTYMFYEASSATGSASAVSPAIDLSNIDAGDSAELSFYMHAYGSGAGSGGPGMGTLRVGASTSPTGPFTNVFAYGGDLQTATSDPWVQVGIDISAYVGGDLYIEFNHTTAGDYEGDMSIDTMEVVACEVIPSCLEPTDLIVTSLSTTSADLTWTAGGTESLWNIEVYEQGADTSTATPVYTETGATQNSTTATGLTFGGDYTAYVQADCGGSDGVSANVTVDFSLDYCESTPTSNDASGISNVQLGTTDFPTADVTYADYRDTVVDLGVGETANLLVSFATGYTYDTNVWIDFNDNLEFESSELVFDGTSQSTNPTTLDASFDIALDAVQGNHYMRIGTADSGQSTPNPCYEGSYGVTIDMAVNLIVGGGCSAITTWDGTAWSNGAPDANSYAVMSGAYSTGTDGAITACLMRVDADVTIDGATDAVIGEVLVMAGNTLTIDEDSSLSVSGDFTNSGTVTLNSTADDFSSLIVEGTATGDITYNRYVNVYDDTAGGGWDLVCSPVNMTIADFITANGANIQVLGDDYAFSQYDNALGQWVRYATASQTGSFTAGQGYSMATTAGSTVAFTGTMQTTDQSIDIVNNNGLNGVGRRWNLVSNPFPSYIAGNPAAGTAAGTTNFMNANAAVIDSEFLAVYGWNGSSYDIYNNLSGAFSMAPGQGFWVAALNTTDTALSFTADMRTNSGTGDFVSGPQLLTHHVALKLFNGDTQRAKTDFYFRNGLSLDLDPGYDAAAFNQSTKLSSRLAMGSQETAFSINAMDMDAMQNTRVPLEIKQNAGQTFRVSIADMDLPEDIYVYLEDTLNGTLTSLKDQDFELEAQSDLSGVDRFFIVFKSNSVLSNGDTLGLSALNVYKANNESFVTIAGITPELEKLDVTIYSILGQTVREKSFNPNTATQRVSTQGLASGLYMVQIKSGNQTTVKKVIIK